MQVSLENLDSARLLIGFFFLAPNPIRQVPTAPTAMPQFGPKLWPNPQKKKKKKKKKKIAWSLHTMAQ